MPPSIQFRIRNGLYGRLAVAAAAAVTLGVTSPAATRAGSEAVVGIVMDETANPLPGASVGVYRDDHTASVQGRTDETGGFCLASDTLSELAAHTICLPAAAGKAACADGRANTVAGTVLGRDALPLSGRPVTVYAADWSVITTGTTDQDGLYCVTNDRLQPDATYQVCVGGLPAGWVFGGISGWMFGAQDRPLPLATITVNDSQGQGIAAAQTDEEGHYCVAGNDLVIGGIYRVCAEVMASTGACPPAAAPAVSGAMFDAAGDPIDFAKIAVTGPNGSVLVEGATNASGAYCIADSRLADGETHFVCIERIAICSGCCGGGGFCCQSTGTSESTVVPVGTAVLPAAIIVPLLYSSGGGSGGGPPISPSE
jgi:hypothetical protein